MWSWEQAKAPAVTPAFSRPPGPTEDAARRQDSASRRHENARGAVHLGVTSHVPPGRSGLCVLVREWNLTATVPNGPSTTQQGPQVTSVLGAYRALSGEARRGPRTAPG